MDLVYIVTDGADKERLKYSLRSIDKFAPKFHNIWIVGHKPEWVTEAEYIPTKQFLPRKQESIQSAIKDACQTPHISEDFILMDDSYILTKKVRSWKKHLEFVQGTLKDKIKQLNNQELRSDARNYFQNLELIQIISGNDNPDNYETPLPIILNKFLYLKLATHDVVSQFMGQRNSTLYRSLYGNIHHKYKANIPTERIWVEFCESEQLKEALDIEFPNKCKYEKE